MYRVGFYQLQKNSDTPPVVETIPPGLTATIDGTPVTFNARVAAYNSSSSGIYNLSIVGTTGITAPFDQLIVAVSGGQKPATGTYHHIDGSGIDYALLVYDISGGASYIEDYTSTAAQHPVTINVTILTSTNVQGTFSGQIVMPGATATGLKVITNGKFNVNF